MSDVVVEERLELVLAWQLVQRGLEVNFHHLAVAVLHAGARMLVGVSTLSERVAVKCKNATMKPALSSSES